jgi:hypothetical protein
MTDPERFGSGAHADDRPPLIEPGVRIGAFSVLGRQAYPTAANRRPTRLAGAGRIGEESGCQHRPPMTRTFILFQASAGTATQDAVQISP